MFIGGSVFSGPVRRQRGGDTLACAREPIADNGWISTKFEKNHNSTFTTSKVPDRDDYRTEEPKNVSHSEI